MSPAPEGPSRVRDWSEPPRTTKVALEAILLPDAGYTLHRLLDAMRALPQFGDPDRSNFHEFHPETAIFGNIHLWTYTEAREVIDHAFGPEGHDNLKHAVATFRKEPVADLDDIFFVRCAILLRAGWIQRDGYLWWTHCFPELTLTVAAAWIGSWDLESLNMCAAARMGNDELEQIIASGQRPDPEAVRTLIGLTPNAEFEHDY